MPTPPPRPGVEHEEPRWGPATTYRARPRLRTGEARERAPERRRPAQPAASRPAASDRAAARQRPVPASAGAGRTATAARPTPGGSAPAVPAGPPRQPAAPRRPVSRLHRRRRTVAVLALLVLVALVVYPVLLARTALGSLERVDALGSSTLEDTPGTDVLVVGSDSREGTDIGGDAEGARTDTIMLLHVPDGGGPSVLVSIPRDSYVEVPGYYETKINAAFSLGGAPLLVDTVEQATGIHVDDYVETGFEGFADLVDAVGGVELCPRTAMDDPKAHLDIEAGCQEMDGATALGYARSRYVDARGDLGRADRQRELLGQIMKQGSSPALLLNPFRAFPTAEAGGGALTVDESTGMWDLLTFARGMRAASGGDGVSMTVPVADTSRMTNSGQVVDWDEDAAGALWKALRTDDTEQVRDIAQAQADEGS